MKLHFLNVQVVTTVLYCRKWYIGQPRFTQILSIMVSPLEKIGPFKNEGDERNVNLMPVVSHRFWCWNVYIILCATSPVEQMEWRCKWNAESSHGHETDGVFKLTHWIQVLLLIHWHGWAGEAATQICLLLLCIWTKAHSPPYCSIWLHSYSWPPHRNISMSTCTVGCFSF